MSLLIPAIISIVLGLLALGNGRAATIKHIRANAFIRSLFFLTFGLGLALIALSVDLLGGIIMIVAGIGGLVVAIVGISQRLRRH